MASAGQAYKLFDLPVRLLFAYKNLPYETEWIEYPELERLKELGLPPNPSGPNGEPPNAAYTVPAVTFPDGQTVMDSAAIATRIERMHPTPPLRGIPAHTAASPASASSADPAERKTAEWLAHIRRVFPALETIVWPRVVEDVVSDASRAHREATVLAETGWASLADGKARFSWDEAVVRLAPAIKGMGDWIDAGDRPFLMGDLPCWADICVVSMLEFLRCCGQDIFDRVTSLDGAEGPMRLYRTARERGWFDKED